MNQTRTQPGVMRKIVGASLASMCTTGLLVHQLAAPANAQATVFYVSPTGKDTNAGTATEPWATVTKAVSTLTAGQTVLIAEGTYAGGLEFTRSGAPGQPIVIAAAPGASPTINVTDVGDSGAEIIGASYIRIQGLEFVYNGPSAANDGGKRYEAGIEMFVNAAKQTPHHIDIWGNNIHGFPGSGVGAMQADHIRIEGNAIHNNSRWNEYNTSAISLYQSVDVDNAPGPHMVIRGNWVWSNENKVPDKFSGVIGDGNCIIIDDQRRYQGKLEGNKTADGAYKSDTLIENNICAWNGGRGIHVFNSDNVVARNNTVYQNLNTPGMSGGELTAIFAVEPGDEAKQIPRRGNVQFFNNVIVSNGSNMTATFSNVEADRNNSTFGHNLYYGTSALPSPLNPGDIASTTDPLLELSTGYFRLRPGSKAIDAARADQAASIDITWQPRTRGNAPDLGAWEFAN